MMHGFSTFKILPQAKLLETHGHDLVLLFRLPNLPRQDILRILLDLALNNQKFPNPPPPITVLRCTISRAFLAA
jgi:hypothetical protein